MDMQTTARIRAHWEAELARNQRGEAVAGMPALPPIPAARYVSPEFYALEQKYLWRRSWLIAGHVDDVPEVGSYKVWRDVGVPILIVRGRDHVIRAFYNTCQHRGSSVVKGECGKVSVLACPYHFWTYDLSGQLKQVPLEHEFPGLDKATRNLVAVRLELWGNLIFVNLDPDAVPLLDFMAPLQPDFDDVDLHRVKVIARIDHEVRCNWKVLTDAFQESYHLEAVHPQTINHMLDMRRQHVTLFRNGHSRLLTRKRTDTPLEAQVLDRGRTSNDPRHAISRESGRSYGIFPNMVSALAEFQWFLMAYWPTSINTTRLQTWYLAPPGHDDPESAECREVIESFEFVTREDASNLESVQQSMETEAFRSLPLCAMERCLYHSHEQVDRAIGPERIPESCRVVPVLGDFVES
jgi:phenylpropionate dioxygenase-like ring-hydroxylating dioxygenase large terminal subunit